MTPREFFVGKGIGFGIVIVLAIGFLGYNVYLANPEPATVQQEENKEAGSITTFTWRYEAADSLNLDGMPETNVFLDALYSNGTTRSQLIATTPGGCNDLPESEPDSASGSVVAQCYSAGLGYRFKVIQGETSYLVQQKMFEEALPESDTPEYQYETKAEFSFLK